MDKTLITKGKVISVRVTDPNEKGKQFCFADVLTDMGLVCHYRFVPLSLHLQEGDDVRIFVDYDYNYNFTTGIDRVKANG